MAARRRGGLPACCAGTARCAVSIHANRKPTVKRQASAPPHWSSAMSRPNGATSLPEIIMGESEYDRLLELAAAAGRRAPETAAPLLQELEQAGRASGRESGGQEVKNEVG